MVEILLFYFFYLIVITIFFFLLNVGSEGKEKFAHIRKKNDHDQLIKEIKIKIIYFHHFPSLD